MTTLTGVLSQCARDVLEQGEAFTPTEVIECARRDYPEVFEDATERLVQSAAARIVKDILRELTEDDAAVEQLALPGLRLPSAIFVRTPDGDYYRATRRAVWSELKAGEGERVRNVQAAQAKLDQYRDSMERLQPVMESFPARSVEEALGLLRGER